jgi:hypothetical protein
MQGSVSEVARLRLAIEDECIALQNIFTAPAIVASHEMVRHKYNTIGQHQDQLAKHVGEEQALNEMIEIHNRIVVGETPS